MSPRISLPFEAIFWFFFSLVLALLTIPILFSLGVSKDLPSITSGQDLNLRVNGDLFQGNKKVASPHVQGPTTSLRFTVFPENSGPVSYLQSIYLPTDLPSGKFTADIFSIQGTSQMQVEQTAPRQLALYLPMVIPESHTVVNLLFPTSYFHLSLWVRFFSWLTSQTTPFWILFSVIPPLLALLMYGRFSEKPKYFSHQLLNKPPEDITALEMAMLLRGHLQANDISALLFDLAHRGYIQLVEKADSVYFLPSSKFEHLRSYEVLVLNLVAPIGQEPRSIQEIISLLTEDLFSQFVNQVYIELYDNLYSRNYFAHHPRKLHLFYKTLGIVLQFYSLILTLISYFILSNYLPGLVMVGGGGFLAGLIIYCLGYRHVSLTTQGKQVLSACYAFINYLTSPSPVGKEGEQGYLFYDYLPYALVIGKEDSWFARFPEERFYVPSWFNSLYHTSESPVTFFHHVQEVTLQLANLFVLVKDPNVD